MNEMDKFPEMMGHFIIVDNAFIHVSEEVGKMVISRFNNCIYLPSYSPELNPIEQFWDIVKGKFKRSSLMTLKI
jgi:transposase